MKLPRLRKQWRQELDEELDSHLRMASQQHLDRGVSADEAGHAARREFGNVALVQHVTREQWGWLWLEELLQSFGDRILPVDEKVAQNWGRLNAGSVFPVIDSLLAATAEAHGLTLATRNLKDIERSIWQTARA